MDAITVGGPPGAGTSTVCRLLEKEMNIEYIYAGEIFRIKAKEMGMSLNEFGDLCEKDPNYDHQLDEDMMEIARKGNVLVEGRMIGPLCKSKEIPSFRIYVDADPRTRAERVMERDGGTLESVIAKMKDREESEAQRYMEYYDIDPREAKWYDLLIDSTNMTPEEEIEIIMKEMVRRYR